MLEPVGPDPMKFSSWGCSGAFTPRPSARTANTLPAGGSPSKTAACAAAARCLTSELDAFSTSGDIDDDLLMVLWAAVVVHENQDLGLGSRLNAEASWARSREPASQRFLRQHMFVRGTGRVDGVRQSLRRGRLIAGVMTE